MSEKDAQPVQDGAGPGDRLSRMSGASLRINESLDADHERVISSGRGMQRQPDAQ